MLQQNPTPNTEEDLFRQRLFQIIDMRHELVRLSRIVDWESLAESLQQYYCLDNGRPGGSIRLMAGLLLLKELKGISDEEVCATWRENPYFQYFCGEEYFQHRLPVEPPSLSIFRTRIGESGMELLLAETIRLGLVSGVVKSKECERVIVDSTVQEKAVTFPTDSKLCHKARLELVKLAQRHEVTLRQSYARKGKRALFLVNKYAAAGQMKRARTYQKQLQNYLGRVIRELERKGLCGDEYAEPLRKARIIYAQAGNPKAQDKLYSWHAVETECIGKGKAHKKYEFGCKASFVSTHQSNFILGAKAFHGRPYDGHTLKPALEQATRLSGVRPKEAYTDGGYQGHGIEGETTVILPKKKRGITKAQKKRRKRRCAIEPIIGHCKNDRKVGPRNWLKGQLGDKINAIAMAIGFNLRKIIQAIFCYLIQSVCTQRIFIQFH